MREMVLMIIAGIAWILLVIWIIRTRQWSCRFELRKTPTLRFRFVGIPIFGISVRRVVLIERIGVGAALIRQLTGLTLGWVDRPWGLVWIVIDNGWNIVTSPKHPDELVRLVRAHQRMRDVPAPSGSNAVSDVK